jgi:hypothetical protein
VALAGSLGSADATSGSAAYADTAIYMGYRAVRDLQGLPSPDVSRGVDGVVAG